MSFWVYILKCSDNSYYTGHTDNLEQRVAQHHARAFASCYTATRLPVEVVYAQSFSTREEALQYERQIKGWSRKKKEAMMQGNWLEVSRLAQNALRQAQGERDRREMTDSDNSVRDERINSVRGEPVDSVRGEPVEPVRGEPVEPRENHNE